MKKKLISILLITLLQLTTSCGQVFAQTISPSASTSATTTDSTTPSLPQPSPTTPTVTPAPSTVSNRPAPTQVKTDVSPAVQNPFIDTTPFSSAQNSAGQTLSSLLVSSFGSSQIPGSALIRQPAVVQKLLRHNFKMDETIQLTVSNATADKVKAWLTDWKGQTVNTVFIDKQTVNTQTAITVDPPAVGFKPGKYTLHITDPDGHTTTQDFTWGVLALNTNKSVYTPDETAKIAMAVLDDKGATVCDAKVQLQITNPQSASTQTLSTDNGKITITPQCNSHALSLTPDYEASYQVAGAGQYAMTLTATTKNGTYSIDDSIDVADSVPFDVERSTATRIYPPNRYPVIFHIKANQDFTGTVTEYAPANFDISPYATGSAQTYTSSSLQVPPVNTEQQFGVSSVMLSRPFSGSYPLEQGFGAKMTDPEEAPYYASFGLAGHDGLDFGLPSGTPVLAADDGVVSLAGDGAYGITVVIDHSWGKSYYGHLSKVLVKVGDKVSRGFEIGLSGATGHVTGPHLHFGIKPKNPDMANGYYGKVDPMPYLSSSPLLAGDSSHSPLLLGEGQGEVPQDNDSQILGISTTTIGQTAMKVIKWNISIKKGDSIDLAYMYHAPNVSPQFYNLGPLTFTDSNGTTQFQEQRQWQIAVDAAPTSAFTDGGSVAIGTSATTLVSQTTSFANSNNLIIAPCLFNTTNTTTHTIAAGSLVLQNTTAGTTLASNPYALANGSNTGPRGTFAYTFVYQDSGATASPTYTIQATASSTGLNGECKIEVLNGVTQTSFTSGSDTAIQTTSTTLASTTMSAAGDNVVIAAIQLSDTTSAASRAIAAGALQITNGAGTIASNTYIINLQALASGNLSADGVLLIGRDPGAAASSTYNVVATSNGNTLHGQANILVLNGFDSAYVDANTGNSSGANNLSTSTDTTISSISPGFAGGENIVIAGNQLDNIKTTASNTSGVDLGNLKMKSGTSTITSNTFNIFEGAHNAVLESHGAGLVFDDTSAGSSPTYSVTGQADSTAANAINAQAELLAFSLAAPSYTQATYRLFANNNSTSVGSPLAAQNTPATLSSSGQAFRLRMTINVTNNQLGQSGQAFKLQYVDPGTGTCSSPSGGMPSTYTDVTSSTAIAYHTNSGATDGSALTASGNDPTDGSNTINDETYNDANNFSNDIVWIPKGQDGLWDFSLIDNSGTSGKTYCFRAVASDGTTFATYTNYPSVTTSGSGGGGGPSIQAGVPWYNYNWQYRRQITIHHSQVSGSNSPVLDATSVPCSADNGYCVGPVSSESWTHTTGNQNNRLLVVAVQTATNPTAPTVSSITYNGVNLTKAGSITAEMNSQVNQGDAELWYLVNPASGSNTITVTLSGNATDFFAGAETFYNVDQTTPVGTAVTTNNGNVKVTPQTITVSSTNTNQIVVDSIVDNNAILAPGSNQTRVESTQVGTLVRGGNSYKQATAGSTTMSWTPGSADWYGMVAVPINPAGLTNFPVLISFSSDSSLAAHARSDGNDILFTDSTGQALLNYEIEKYTSGTGELEAWVNIPSLSSSTDTIIYMYYGNPSQTSSLQAPASTWNSNYVSVWHLSQTALPQNDSTGNAINIVNRDTGTSPTLGTATGIIDGADQFSSGADSAANTNANSALLPSNFTLQAWVNFSSFNTTDDAFIVWKRHSVSPFESYSLEVNTSKNVTCQWKNSSGTGFSAFGNTVLSTGTWYNIACIKNGTSLQVYVNGVNDTNGTVTTSGTVFNSDSGMIFGSGNTAESPNAIVDEVRLANTALSSTWLTTEYNNQSSPSSFFTMDSTVQTPIYAPSLDQLMRHGKWFCPTSSINGDTSCTSTPGKQPFAF